MFKSVVRNFTGHICYEVNENGHPLSHIASSSQEKRRE